MQHAQVGSTVLLLVAAVLLRHFLFSSIRLLLACFTQLPRKPHLRRRKSPSADPPIQPAQDKYLRLLWPLMLTQLHFSISHIFRQKKDPDTQGKRGGKNWASPLPGQHSGIEKKPLSITLYTRYNNSCAVSNSGAASPHLLLIKVKLDSGLTDIPLKASREERIMRFSAES